MKSIPNEVDAMINKLDKLIEQTYNDAVEKQLVIARDALKIAYEKATTIKNLEI